MADPSCVRPAGLELAAMRACELCQRRQQHGGEVPLAVLSTIQGAVPDEFEAFSSSDAFHPLVFEHVQRLPVPADLRAYRLQLAGCRATARACVMPTIRSSDSECGQTPPSPPMALSGSESEFTPPRFPLNDMLALIMGLAGRVDDLEDQVGFLQSPGSRSSLMHRVRVLERALLGLRS